MIAFRKHAYLSALFLVGLIRAGHLFALQADDVRVTEQGGAYTTHLAFDVTASVDKVKAILTDYEHADRLAPEVTMREIIGRQNGKTRVRTTIHGCIFLFCKDLTLIQDVTVSSSSIRADVVPQESDFRSGYLLWRLTETDSGVAHIEYESVVTPGFFIPPLVGRSLFRRRLQGEIYATAKNLQEEAARVSHNVTQATLESRAALRRSRIARTATPTPVARAGSKASM